MKLIKKLNLFQPIEFLLSKFDSLDPTYQTSKREFDRLEKLLGNEKKVHQPGILSYSLQIETCFKVSCFHDVDRSSTIKYTHMAHRGGNFDSKTS